ncbi:hypothetical protein [Hymenobacter sp. B81]|uniref:hypothetical protein n=1 Tax=Hymenobacter sp. B81 TaxID=3344878 RepID=UPI0037DCA2FE
MKRLLFGVLMCLFTASASAQTWPSEAYERDWRAGEDAEHKGRWEQAEASFAKCLAVTPTDTLTIQVHAYAAINSLARNAVKPESSAKPDYLALAVRDYDALVAAGKLRYLLNKAQAYGLRAEATTDPAEAKKLLELALASVAAYEKQAHPTDASKETRRALLDVARK